MDFAPRNPVSPNAFVLFLIFAWSFIFIFRRQIQHSNAHCSIIIAMIITVCSNPLHGREISEHLIRFLQLMMPWMIYCVRSEIDRASR
ncbi:unnamed protein product [Caenorhabditis angaria]|uniref:Uncharacterized protein n=1 Tax=Caenorhabditis angaria TaxID=860376 RepID=A0A9P1IF05_9PELO|nr:unnamed protein product [Caenorhabditis angaria]